MSENMFLREINFYKRQLNPIEQYVQQTSFYLHKMTDRPIEVCKEHTIASIKSADSQSRNPTVRYFERGDNGDKEPQELPLSEYIKTVIANDEILVPTFTSYLNPKQQSSILVEFTDNNKKRRSKAKKEAFKAQAAKLDDLFIIKDNEQTNMKLYNNSMSGAFATKGSVLHNPTAHNTLTSTIRSITAISNASNEKIIEGNRHYYNPDVTLFNLISITSSLDSRSLSNVIDKYNLVYPSVKDVIDCVKRSTDLYWHDFRAMDEIESFVSKLSDVERAAVVYTSDMFHIRKYNDAFMRQFLSELSKKVTEVQIEDCLAKIYKVDELIINFAHQICLKEMRGIGKDYEKIPYEDLQTVVATCYNIESTVLKYKDFIEVIFLTSNVPASTSHLPNMVRRTVLVSDTDSTMFSVDSWVQWYYGNMIFNEETFALAGSVMFMATQCMAHALAIFSANMNVEKSKLFDLAMKPEFVFPILCQTAVAKHYFTFFNIKEGNVFDKPVMEIKGVYLKDSSLPTMLVKDSQQIMKDILMAVFNNEKISITNLLKHLSEKEQSINTSLLEGNTVYYKKSNIKQPAAYASSAEQSPYVHHMFWQSIFEPKYGAMEPPPYSVIKIPTTVVNITAVKKWTDSIEDKALATRLAEWLSKHKKTKLPTIYLSEVYVAGFGIPEEIKPIIDIKKIVLQLTGIDRMIIESLGYCPKTEFLISEQGY